jgi:sugar/nucleoside kinase (ribokinase family)
VDFLAIGHICHDIVPGGRVAGGAAAYSALVAQAIGCRSGVVTSGAAEDDWAAVFPELAVCHIPSPQTTVFENVYTPAGRVQTIHAVAGRIGSEHVPPLWTRAPMVMLGPIANELDPGLVSLFSDSVVGVAPQGWLRGWDKKGRVHPIAWPDAAAVLPLAAVTFVSEEDLPDAATLDEYRRLAGILVLTQGARGCTVFCRGEAREFPAPPVVADDLTGAGDTFAAAYLTRFLQTDGNLWAAAEFANHVAAEAITQRGLLPKMQRIRQLVAELTQSPASGRW